MVGNVPLNELCEILQKWWKWRFMKRKWKSSCLTIFYSEKSLWSVLFLERSRIILDKPISVPKKKKLAAQRSVTQPYIRPHTVVTPLRFFSRGDATYQLFLEFSVIWGRFLLLGVYIERLRVLPPLNSPAYLPSSESATSERARTVRIRISISSIYYNTKRTLELSLPLYFN